jgi:hypothetical protein
MERRFGAKCSRFLKILENCNFCFLKNYEIYFINTYTCPGYSCKVLVEISMYFELQKKTKVMATYRLIFLSEICLFLYSSKYNILFYEIFTVPLKCLYVCPYLISDFLKS